MHQYLEEGHFRWRRQQVLEGVQHGCCDQGTAGRQFKSHCIDIVADERDKRGWGDNQEPDHMGPIGGIALIPRREH